MDRYTLCLRSTHIGDIELHSLSIVLEDPSEVEAKVLAFFLASNADYSLQGFSKPQTTTPRISEKLEYEINPGNVSKKPDPEHS